MPACSPSPRPGLPRGTIVAAGAAKRFKLYDPPWRRGLDWLSGGRLGRPEESWPLSDLSFHIKAGESVGIIGLNGAGKSTLLKLIAGVLSPTSGTVAAGGSVLALLELGGGFHPELSGRENVRHLTALLHFPPGYADAEMDNIEAFADIGSWFDSPVRAYSSGMLVRLALSAYLFLAPDVLIVDEALAVGDIFFQQKCYGAMRERVRGGTTLLFVSHDMAAIRAMCERTLLLDHGRLVFDGATEEAVGRYTVALGRSLETGAGSHRAADARPVHAEPAAARRLLDRSMLGPRPPDPARTFEFLAVGLTGPNGGDGCRLRPFDRLTLEVLVAAHETVVRPNLGFELHDQDGALVFSTSFLHLGNPMARLAAGSTALARLIIECAVRPGCYTLSVDIGELDGVPHANMAFVRDRLDGLGPIEVVAGPEPPSFEGLVHLPAAVSILSV